METNLLAVQSTWELGAAELVELQGGQLQAGSCERQLRSGSWETRALAQHPDNKRTSSLHLHLRHAITTIARAAPAGPPPTQLQCSYNTGTPAIDSFDLTQTAGISPPVGPPYPELKQSWISSPRPSCNSYTSSSQLCRAHRGNCRSSCCGELYLSWS